MSARACPPCTRVGCPFRAMPGAQRLPTHRQLRRWNRQAVAKYESPYRTADEHRLEVIRALLFGAGVAVLMIGAICLGVVIL